MREDVAAVEFRGIEHRLELRSPIVDGRIVSHRVGQADAPPVEDDDGGECRETRNKALVRRLLIDGSDRDELAGHVEQRWALAP